MIRKLILGAVAAVVIGLGAQTASAAPAVIGLGAEAALTAPAAAVEASTQTAYRGRYEYRHYAPPRRGWGYRSAPRRWWR
jgi:hypothetical protein